MLSDAKHKTPLRFKRSICRRARWTVRHASKWPAGARGGLEQKRTILHGAGQSLTVLHLPDAMPGFADKKPKALMWTGNSPVQRFRNAVRDLTSVVGRGNPGAIGLQFNASNQVSMGRKAASRRSDPTQTRSTSRRVSPPGYSSVDTLTWKSAPAGNARMSPGIATSKSSNGPPAVRFSGLVCNVAFASPVMTSPDSSTTSASQHLSRSGCAPCASHEPLAESPLRRYPSTRLHRTLRTSDRSIIAPPSIVSSRKHMGNLVRTGPADGERFQPYLQFIYLYFRWPSTNDGFGSSSGQNRTAAQPAGLAADYCLGIQYANVMSRLPWGGCTCDSE